MGPDLAPSRLGAALALGIILLASPSPAAEGAVLVPDADGQRLFEENCAACHSGGMPRAPSLPVLRRFSPTVILETLTHGTMRDQAAHLDEAQKRAVASFAAGKPFRTVSEPASAFCPAGHTVTLAEDPVWPGWDGGIDNAAFQPAEAAGLTLEEVKRLALKWAFAVPDGSRMRGQPAIIGSLLLLPTQRGQVYALDRESGCIVWERTIGRDHNSAIALGRPQADGPWLAFLGDSSNTLRAIEVETGRELWAMTPHPHRTARLSGSPRYHDGRVFIGVSSHEVASAARADRSCCSFRGAVVAVDALDGELLWRTYTIAEEAQPTYENAQGVMQTGPSGAPVWTTPAIAPSLNLLFVGTGQNYSTPASDMSDAIIAMDLDTGAIAWAYQGTEGDAYNLACYDDMVNCPKENGPDFDFGASPVLVDGPDGPLVLAGQKSSVVHALDAATGALRWKTRVGAGGTLGGVHFGMAVDESRVFVPVSDRFDARDYPDPRQPGVFALDIASGAILWRQAEPRACAPEDAWCQVITGFSAAPTAIPGAVFSGSIDGTIYAFAAETGEIIWQYDTARDFETVNGVPGSGGSLDAAGPVIAHGMVYVNSGYTNENQIPGNVLLAFSVDGR